ncbi:hypothetical protein PHSY_001183 [Pseudozyma hubeiensis SY62]|uniref:DUF1996 domain-containing protein n=1 Tax=Pseudozyma hubeiensis (strain SY62) TaxID=1305764 RepID=R9NXZ8_PSEHS|nr:hypothetical protein PHSY_001183 [Pseudozyma hubeiensis SY62]GAC93618.1 hypothetical protein PHSY_001183 [Pseudozyma hubeiensis SY62]
MAATPMDHMGFDDVRSKEHQIALSVVPYKRTDRHFTLRSLSDCCHIPPPLLDCPYHPVSPKQTLPYLHFLHRRSFSRLPSSLPVTISAVHRSSLQRKMWASRNLILLTLVAAWCALFAVQEASATLADPVMWILVHGRLKQARIDPIVTPGGTSSHVHSLVGANGVSADTTTAQSLEAASSCTTSGIHADMSAYWAPSLYSVNANGTFSPRRLDYVNTYYLMRGNVNITAFPRSMQLLAGNAMRRGPGPTTQADNTASFVCLNYADGSSQSQTIPTRPCPQGLRLQVVFPSCWNGKDLVSADRSHVVYPLGDNADNGPCPASHNVRLPTLFYEFVFDVTGITNANYSELVLSNGDSMGYSFHADFIAAWNETILQDAIDECAGLLFNNLESCPPLAKTLDRQASNQCTASSSEATSGTIPSLPGCNMVWNGPNAGKGLTAGCDPNKVMLKPDNYTAPASSSSLSASTSSAATAAASKKASAQAGGVIGGALNSVQSAKLSTPTSKTVKHTPEPTPKKKHAPKKATIQATKEKGEKKKKKKSKRPSKVQRKKNHRHT